MATSQNPDMKDVLIAAIGAEIKRQATALYEKKKVELIEAFDRDKDAIIAGIVVHITSYVDFAVMGQQLVLTIRKIEPRVS